MSSIKGCKRGCPLGGSRISAMPIKRTLSSHNVPVYYVQRAVPGVTGVVCVYSGFGASRLCLMRTLHDCVNSSLRVELSCEDGVGENISTGL